MTKHTSTPWRAGGFIKLMTPGGGVIKARIVSLHPGARPGNKDESTSYDIAYICEVNPKADDNAERIVACVNACAGIADPEKFISNAKRLLETWGARDNTLALMRAAAKGGGS